MAGRQLTVAEAIEFEDLAHATVLETLAALDRGDPTARQALAVVWAFDELQADPAARWQDLTRQPYPTLRARALALADDGDDPPSAGAARPSGPPPTSPPEALTQLQDLLRDLAHRTGQDPDEVVGRFVTTGEVPGGA